MMGTCPGVSVSGGEIVTLRHCAVVCSQDISCEAFVYSGDGKCVKQFSDCDRLDTGSQLVYTYYKCNYINDNDNDYDSSSHSTNTLAT